jgi:Tol biopolymer transport system component
VAIEPGQQLLHYRLTEKIGEGGMGEVWKAEDTKLRRHVALKVLPERMAADPERRARFEREARAVAALNHPNIVTLHSVEESDGVHFITMELVEGRNLKQLLPRGGLPLNRLLEIAIPLADAVSRAHSAGITHRDLKPDNIMLDTEGRLRVLDFGLAKLQEPTGSAEAAHLPTATAMTGEGKIVGTVAYMSPEQAEGKPVDHRSDIFSLGTILYEMATGKRPFQGETSMSTIGAILKDEPSSVTEINPALPRHAGRILRRCLAKDPERRYQTALDLRNELEELKAEIDSGIHAAQAAGAAAPSRRSRVPIIAGAVVVIAVAATVTIRLQDRGESRATEFVSRPITASSAYDSGPAWSPDGTFIAFERMTSGDCDVYVKPLDGGEAVARADGPGDQFFPRWTPDGRYLAYISRHQPGSSVFLVPADGGKPRELIATGIPTLDFDTNPLGDRPWSSDGQTLLVSRVTDTMLLAVHRVDRTTGEAEQVTFPEMGNHDSHATYSFDGKRIVFRRLIEGRGALLIMPAEGGDPEVLLQDEFDYGGVAWRPDNRHVVFQSNRGALQTKLFEIDVVTRKIRPLTSETRNIWSFSVSLDDRIAYAPSWHDTFLHVVDVETGEREQITSHAWDNGHARFAPDGRTVAYSSNRTGNFEIWLHHLDGRPETRFTDHAGMDAFPEWSPDGQRLIFLSDRDGGALKPFIANADGGTRPRLLIDRSTTWPGWDRVVLWSPDGESIAYRITGDEGPVLWTVGPDGMGARKRLEGVTGFDWYRDDRRGLITRRHGTEVELVAVDLESGREETLLVGALQEIDVAPDGRAVAFCYGRGHLSMGLAVLKLEAPSDPDGLPRAVGEPEYVVPTEGSWHVHNGGWSPDSQRLVYTQDEDYGDIYELVEKR